jgi:hypothetical protein
MFLENSFVLHTKCNVSTPFILGIMTLCRLVSHVYVVMMMMMHV